MADVNYDLYHKVLKLVESIADTIVRGDKVYQCPVCYHRNTQRDCNEQGVIEGTTLTCTECGEEVECETFIAEEDEDAGDALQFFVHEARQIL
jgi:transcription elongation factor Elf1